ncbi:MAG TPA: O-methyltransferase [Bacteroidales bacterium]|nr:O-methyltransferase [Bacteroidales bacterium]
MTELDRDLEAYILDHIDEEEDLLYRLSRYTNLTAVHPRMLSGHLQGKILRMLTLMIKPRTILELGTFTGYSALCLASGLPENGIIHTIEANDEIVEVAYKFINQSEHASKINIHVGDARKIIPTFNFSFDLVFIDAEKSEYLDYYHLVFDKVSPGGFIFADNVLWSGKILDKNENDNFTRGIKEFNDFVKSDNRVEKVILPIRDGLTVIRKK